jgi:hypothetical protein
MSSRVKEAKHAVKRCQWSSAPADESNAARRRTAGFAQDNMIGIAH